MSLEGQQIDRYRILRLLGSGGMGEVYLAEDARIEQQVAIKVIRAEVSPYPDHQVSQDAARLFQREAKAIAQLDHPHILPLFDYGEEHLGNMTVIYLVMPYRREGSLSDWLRQRGQAGLLSPQEVAHVVRQAASALQHAHDRQIIHQDVKPSNFLIRHRPEKPTRPDLLLADFGVARFSTATASASQTVRGTPTYMAPEQWAGQPVPASDQYALAIMSYELLAGRPPFQGPLMQVMYQHVHMPPPPPSTHNPRLSADVDTVLLHALAKQPQERFASIASFANTFQQSVQATQEDQAPKPPVPTPPLASQNDLRAALAISVTEAQNGTTRTLTLPGGRQVTVSVPAGVRDGQIMRLEGQGAVSPAGGPAGALILSILVKAAEEPSPLSAAIATETEPTVLTANPMTPATSAPTVSTTGQQPTESSAARTELSTPPSPPIAPTEATTPVNQGSLPPTGLALPTEPSLGRPGEMTPSDQSEQQAGVLPAARSSWPPETAAAQPPSLVVASSQSTLRPAQRGISRRAVVVGLAGLAVVGVAGGGLLWLARSQQPAVLTAPLRSTSSTAVAMFGFNAQHTRFNPDEHILSPTNVSRLVQYWAATPGMGATGSSPAVVNGIVYIVFGDSLYAFQDTTGKSLWTAPTTRNPVSCSPAVAGGIVYMSADPFPGSLYAFNAKTGASLWTASIGDDIGPSSPTVANGIVYVQSNPRTGTLYAFNAKTGASLWTASTTKGLDFGSDISSSPAVANGVVYVGSGDHKLYAFDATNGKILWTTSTAIGTYPGIGPSSFTVANGVIYVGSGDKLYAFHLPALGVGFSRL
jgi:serine/threonine protein kinase